ncbi:MAG TPA: GNAT family N-acetyltransferase [Asanoa sp.]|nr:GNAT family N-acetyltransferase [Asanoa sp.]
MTAEPFAVLAEAGVVLREYRGIEDVEGIQAVRVAVRRAEGDVWLPGPDGSDDPAATHPFCLVAADIENGGIIGFAWMHWWDEADGTRLYLLSGCVEPRWRRRGVGTSILLWQEEQATAFDRAGSSTAAFRVFGVNVALHQAANLAMLTAQGYGIAFTVVEMTCDLRTPPDGDTHPLPAGLVLRPVDPTHHPVIHEVIEECFAGARDGYQARTHEEYLRDVRDVGLWCVAWDGDEVAAVAVNELQPDGTATTPWVAVRAPWRLRGVGHALMRHTLRALADRGVTLARLTTIQENPHNSVGLYERAGYTVIDRQPRYRKPLPAPDPAAG